MRQHRDCSLCNAQDDIGMALHIWNCSLCNAQVIPIILPPDVVWVAAIYIPGIIILLVNCVLCLVASLIGFHILVLTMLYGLVTSTLWGFY